MFFKAVFALYFAAIALAAPKREVVEVGDVAVEVDGNDIIKDAADNLYIL